jgi:hypothetical protein
MIGALVVGTVLAVAVLAFVLAPLIIGVKRSAAPHSALRTPNSSDFAISALREIEFDRATGKLSDADYATLRERYANEALTAMRRGTSSTPVASDDPVEAAVRAYRDAHPTCAKCGIRPEADAIYCSNCGGFLPGNCDSCGTAVTASGIRYCIDCGHRLAA